MRKFVLLLAFGCLFLQADARNRKVKIVTSKGKIIILLSDKTALHRDNFIKLVKQKF